MSGQGKVVLDFGTTREEEPINQEGEATFKELPSKFIGKEVHVSIHHPQPYFPTLRDTIYKLEKGKSIYLEIELTGIHNIKGTILDFETEKPLDSVRVSVQNIAAYTDNYGWFKLDIPSELQAKFLRVHFYKESYRMETIDSIAPHTKQEIELSLHKN